MRKAILLILALFAFIITGCARIDSQVNINPDYSGTWVANITAEQGGYTIPKTEIENRLKAANITNGQIEAISPISKNEAGVETATEWKVTADFKNFEEMKSLVKAVMGNAVNTDTFYIQPNPQDKGVTDVFLGTSVAGTTKIKVAGDVISDTMTTGYQDKDGTLVFQKGEKIFFQYKEVMPLWQRIAIGLGVGVVIVFGFFYFQYMKKRKDVED